MEDIIVGLERHFSSEILKFITKMKLLDNEKSISQLKDLFKFEYIRVAEEGGWIHLQNDRVFLSDRGKLLANRTISRLLKMGYVMEEEN